MKIADQICVNIYVSGCELIGVAVYINRYADMLTPDSRITVMKEWFSQVGKFIEMMKFTFK